MINKERNTIVLLNFLPSINSSYSKKGATYPNNAVILVGSVLKSKGYCVKIIDGGYYENYCDLLINYALSKKDKILYVGMSVMTTQVPMALSVSKKRCGWPIPAIAVMV